MALYSNNNKALKATEIHETYTSVSTVLKIVFAHHIFGQGIIKADLGMQITHFNVNAIFRKPLLVRIVLLTKSLDL